MLVTIKNGKRTLKLTKRERDTMDNARNILGGIASDFLDTDDCDDDVLHADTMLARETMLSLVSLSEPAKGPAPADKSADSGA